jgi:hypothetical protein
MHPVLKGSTILEHVNIKISARASRLPMYKGVGAVFFKRLLQYLGGIGHPPATAPLIAGLDPPSSEELAVYPTELRCYYFLKAVTDYRVLPARPGFQIEVSETLVFITAADCSTAHLTRACLV